MNNVELKEISFDARLGQMIKEKRKSLGYKTAEFSKITGISLCRLSALENGDSIVQSKEKMEKLSKVLCDDGTIFAMWIMSKLDLKFNENTEKFAIDMLKNVVNARV